MNRREWLASLAAGAAAASSSRAQGTGEAPERKSATEPLDLERKAAETLAGRRPYDPLSYPYFSPDYKLPFIHIGEEKQLFLDNFMLERLEGVERVLTPPEKTPKPLIEQTALPWESTSFSPIVVAAMRDSDAGNFKLWYTVSLSGDPYGTGQVLCIAESNDGMRADVGLSLDRLDARRIESRIDEIRAEIGRATTREAMDMLLRERLDLETELRRLLPIRSPRAKPKG